MTETEEAQSPDYLNEIRVHAYAAVAKDASNNPDFIRGAPYLMLRNQIAMLGEGIKNNPFFTDPIGQAMRQIMEGGRILNETFIKAMNLFSGNYETARKKIGMATLGAYLASITAIPGTLAGAYAGLGDKPYESLNDKEKAVFADYTESVTSLGRRKLMVKGLEEAVAEEGQTLNRSLEEAIAAHRKIKTQLS